LGVIDEGRSTTTRIGRLWSRPFIRWPILFLPTLLAGFYYFAVAADQYESEARFVVRSATRPELSGGLSFLVQLGFARSQDDSFIVQDFMRSRDAIDLLHAKLPLEAIFNRDGADPIARYPSLFLYGPTEEQFYRYFLRMVSVVLVDKSGISTLRVNAFRAEDARDIAEALLTAAEGLVNRINQRLQKDAIASSTTQLQSAQARLIEAQAALTDFRNRELIVDPNQNAVAVAELIARLAGELAATQAQITEMQVGSAASPQLAGLRRKAMALDQQIIHERARIASDSGGLAARLAAYERLTFEREFANRLMSAAEAELVRARRDAARQMLYLERVTGPHLPDHSTQPKGLRNVLTILAANILLVLIGWLFVSGVREHAS